MAQGVLVVPEGHSMSHELHFTQAHDDKTGQEDYQGATSHHGEKISAGDEGAAAGGGGEWMVESGTIVE